jgi:hypothetical protein
VQLIPAKPRGRSPRNYRPLRRLPLNARLKKRAGNIRASSTTCARHQAKKRERKRSLGRSRQNRSVRRDGSGCRKTYAHKWHRCCHPVDPWARRGGRKSRSATRRMAASSQAPSISQSKLIRDKAAFEQHWTPDLDEWFDKTSTRPAWFSLRFAQLASRCGNATPQQAH